RHDLLHRRKEHISTRRSAMLLKTLALICCHRQCRLLHRIDPARLSVRVYFRRRERLFQRCLSNIRYALKVMAVQNSASVISSHLRERAKSCASASPNSWQRATYEALGDSDWFCEGGFACE